MSEQNSAQHLVFGTTDFAATAPIFNRPNVAIGKELRQLAKPCADGKAIARRYRYVIYNDPIRPAHLNQEITWNHRPLDVERMASMA